MAPSAPLARFALGTLGAALLILTGVAGASAHDARSGVAVADVAGDTLTVEVLSPVPRAGTDLVLHLEVRDATSGALRQSASTYEALLESVDGTTRLRLEFVPEDHPGHVAIVSIPEAGDWLLRIPWRGDEASFPLRVFPAMDHWADYSGADAITTPADGAVAVAFRILDHATGEAVTDAGAVSVVVTHAGIEADDAWRQEFPARLLASGEFIADLALPDAREYDAIVVAPELGIGRGTQPPLHVHATAVAVDPGDSSDPAVATIVAPAVAAAAAALVAGVAVAAVRTRIGRG